MRRLWSRLARRAPRRLTVSAAGKLLLVLAVALGVMAINTGHNGLFLAWGLAMGLIVVSGVLSELSLRTLRAQIALVGPLRVGQLGRLELILHNSSPRFGAYGLESHVMLGQRGNQRSKIALPLVLTLPGSHSERLGQSFVPQARGAVRLEGVQISTRYPFGFFAKARRMPVAAQLLWVWPQRLEQAPILSRILTSMGERSAAVTGHGDEFFALRPWRPGEDLRRLIWRRLARTGRAFVVETEAQRAQQLMLVAHIDAAADVLQQERAIAAVGTLAEDLLQLGFGIGVRSNGVAISASHGAGTQRHQLTQVLDALARLEVAAPLGALPRTARDAPPELGLVGPGLVAAPHGMQQVALHDGGHA